MTSLDSRAEVLKLARVLGVGPERFGYLAQVAPADLRLLRSQITDMLFDANLGVLQRMAAASRLLPAPLLAKIAERVFGPLLCARIAGLVEPARGVDVAKRLSPRFLADVAAELDPRRANSLISRIPSATVAAVADQLVRREDWIAIGRFVGHLPDETVRASFEFIDDASLLRIAFVLDDKADLDHLIGLLPDGRLDGIMRAAAAHSLWPIALDMLHHVGPAQRARLQAATIRYKP